MEYPFAPFGNAADADNRIIGELKQCGFITIPEPCVGDPLTEATTALNTLAAVLPAVAVNERNEAEDLSVFGKVLLIAVALAEVTIVFSGPEDLPPNACLVAELKSRLVRLLGRLGLVEEALAMATAQSEQKLDSLLAEPLVAHPTERRYRSLEEINDHLRAIDAEVQTLRAAGPPEFVK